MKRGFTLAEVLITLSILGVVAAIMIPSTMHKIQDTQQLAGFKRAYSMLDNALQMMYVVEGLPSTWSDWPSTDEYNSSNANYFAQKLAKYLAVQKYCGSNSGCFSYGTKRKYSNGSDKLLFNDLAGTNSNNADFFADENTNGKMTLKNNMRVSLSARYANHSFTKSRCLGSIRVDINGEKGPNRYGYDVFSFPFDEKGIQTKPGAYCGGNWNSTALGNSDQLKNCNKNVASTAESCYLWILRHNNMDYKYRDVSAEW